MKRRDFLQTALFAATTVSVPSFVRSQGTTGKILYFDLSTEWEHPPTVNEADGTSFSAKIIKQLGEKLDLDVDATKDGLVFDRDLSPYKAFVFYTCGDLGKAPAGKTGVSPTGLRNLLSTVRSGTGFLGIHSATDTWKTAGELLENQPVDKRTEYINMIGGQFITHGEIQEATLRITEPAALPSLKAIGAPTFRFTDEWYAMKNFNRDMHVLLVQETQGMKNNGRNACYDRPSYPSTWIRKEGKGRVAYTAFGHDNERWKSPLVQSIFSDLLSCVTGKIDLDLTPNLDNVCPLADRLRNN